MESTFCARIAAMAPEKSPEQFIAIGRHGLNPAGDFIPGFWNLTLKVRNYLFAQAIAQRFNHTLTMDIQRQLNTPNQ